jgi:hypothetical protein
MNLINHASRLAAEEHGVDRSQFRAFILARQAELAGDGQRAALQHRIIEMRDAQREAAAWGVRLSTAEAYAITGAGPLRWWDFAEAKEDA